MTALASGAVYRQVHLNLFWYPRQENSEFYIQRPLDCLEQSNIFKDNYRVPVLPVTTDGVNTTRYTMFTLYITWVPDVVYTNTSQPYNYNHRDYDCDDGA